MVVVGGGGKKIMQPLRNCNGPTIRIGQEFLCLPYAGFFYMFSTKEKSMISINFNIILATDDLNENMGVAVILSENWIEKRQIQNISWGNHQRQLGTFE